jgi:hypothetical protein
MHARLLCAAALVLGSVQSGWAQSLEQYLPLNVPGFDTTRGAVIRSRPLSEYDPLGIRAGEFIVRPRLDESISYNNNVLGRTNGPGSFIVGTTPTVSFNSDFSRNSLAGSFGLNDTRYLDVRRQNQTDYNAALGGTYQIGNDTLTLGGTEIYEHQTPASIDSRNILQPLGVKVTDVRLQYDKAISRFTFEPLAEYQAYRFDNKVVTGDTLSQKARNRNVFVGALTTRYGLAVGRSAVLVVRGVETRYISRLGGAPRPNSTAYEVLGGVDYAVSGNLLFTLLVGYEIRTFENPVFSNRASPVAEAAVVFTPTGLTTITGRLTRSVEDSIGESTTGVTLTRARLIADQELRRNWLLQVNTGAEFAEYSQGGTEAVYTVGGSVDYRLNRNIVVGGSYAFSARMGSNNTPAIGLLPSSFSNVSVNNTTFSNIGNNNNSGDFTQHLFLVHVGFAL